MYHAETGRRETRRTNAISSASPRDNLCDRQKRSFDESFGDLNFVFGCSQRLGIFHSRGAGRFRIRFIDRLARDGRFRFGCAIRFGRNGVQGDARGASSDHHRAVHNREID